MSVLPPQVPPDQTYGVGQDQLAQQQALPLPNKRGGGDMVPMPSASPTGGSVDPIQQAIAMAQAMPFDAVGLSGPTAEPDEPLTTGIGLGPGAGPEALPPMPHAKNHAAEVLLTLAEARQSPELARLAQQLRGEA